ncbi:calnexin isoform X2 [Anabrus simplex]|uniref:calnexin isoform X2 n=1 Tax=Anabrus simplex TaxID=316456 RepID=UPI0035A3AC5F
MMWKLSTFTFVALMLLYVTAPCLCQDDDDDDEVVTTEELEEPNEDIVYSSPSRAGHAYFSDHFDDPTQFKQKWVVSEAKKEDIDEDIAKYDGEWSVETPLQDGLKGDMGLVLKSKAKHAAIASRLDKPFIFSNKPLIVQYEVTLQDGQECGGAYLKLLSHGKETANLKTFQDKTPYTIMFGPDKCGNDHKLHFIFRHKNPINGTITEKHCKKPKDRLEEPFKDKKPHLYTLRLHPDNTFTIALDQKIINEGSLLEDFTPPVNPPSEIDDPDDKKPEDWDEREKIADPEARKPDDWDESAPAMIPDPDATKPDGWLDDEPEMIPDPNAEKPDDWDADMDGEWEAPLIANPKCESAPGCGPWKAPLINNPAHKGKWRAPLIDNPNYKGKWKPRRIPNPDFFEDKNPFSTMKAIDAVGFELWSMSSNILFDNIIITDDAIVADKWAADTFSLKRRKMEKESESLLMRLVRYTNDHPWLWAVYVIVIGLPIVMIFVFCCGPSTQEKAEKKRAAEAKKTDAFTPDDIPERPRVAPVSKSQLELQEEDSVEQEEDQEASEGDIEPEDEGEKIADDQEQTKENEEEDIKDEKEPISEGAGDAPRSPKKNRSRKE